LVITIDFPLGQNAETGLPLDRDDASFIVKKKYGARFLDSPYAEKIEQRFGDLATYDFTHLEGQSDFVFVDGSHAYLYVKNETEVAWRLLGNRAGTIVWHDYDTTWPGVTQAMNEYFSTDARFKDLFQVEGTSLVVLEKAAS